MGNPAVLIGSTSGTNAGAYQLLDCTMYISTYSNSTETVIRKKYIYL